MLITSKSGWNYFKMLRGQSNLVECTDCVLLDDAISNRSGAKVNCNNYPLRTGNNFDGFHSDRFGGVTSTYAYVCSICEANIQGAVSKTGNVTGHRQINLCPQFALCHFAKFTPLMLYLKVDYSYPQLRLMNRLLINACQCPTSVTISPQHSLSTLPSERVCTAASTLR